MAKAAKKAAKKNKLGVKNSLVNNINARKKKGKSRTKKKSTISRESYNNMEDNWDKKKAAKKKTAKKKSAPKKKSVAKKTAKKSTTRKAAKKK